MDLIPLGAVFDICMNSDKDTICAVPPSRILEPYRTPFQRLKSATFAERTFIAS